MIIDFLSKAKEKLRCEEKRNSTELSGTELEWRGVEKFCYAM
nr:MAG TPA: hypothetical protein [Caudoviricetes sp.]